MRKKFLPIGIQDFRTLREGNYIYVDKTEHVFRLAERFGGPYFMSRPRRFGKSLLVNTLKELFLGSRDLFDGLWIQDKWDWSKTYPVIHLSFDQMSYKDLGLDNALSYELNRIADKHNIVLKTTQYASQFRELIEQLTDEFGSVVILIDEYDKPIIDFLQESEIQQAIVNQKIMKLFYAVLKANAEKIRFLFITGVSKFAKVSIFSDLNHLQDITLNKRYSTIVGYTQTELETNFAEYITEAAESIGISLDDLLENMRLWYNGFSWDGKNKVYNSFGTLNFLESQAFRNYWFSTGTPTFLLEQMTKHTRFDFENTSINSVILDNYTIQNVDLIPLLFQTGYLTIKEMNPLTTDIVLDYPNKEVRESMYQFLIDGLTNAAKTHYYAHDTLKSLIIAFNQANLDKVKDTLNALLAGLPSETFDKKSEGLFHGLIHLVFKLLDIYIKSEVHSSQGRADSIVETETHVFIFEFKFNRTATEAMQQLKDKKYADAYRDLGKKIVGIGVNFVSADKEIKGWVVEDL